MKKYNHDEIFDIISERIKSGVKLRGIDVAKLADKLNIESATLYRNLKKGNGIATPRLIEIANTLNLPIGYFFGEDLLDDANASKINTETVNADYLTIPVYDVLASAGYGIEPLTNDDIIEMRMLSRSFLPRKNGDYHIIFVDGDSMTPTLKPNEPVLIDASIKTIVSPGIYVMRINGGIFIKRIDLQPDGTIEVISDNKAYKDFMIRMGENIQLDIIGKAVLNFQLL